MLGLKISDNQIQIRLRIGVVNSINTHLRLKINPPPSNTQHNFLNIKKSLLFLINLSFVQSCLFLSPSFFLDEMRTDKNIALQKVAYFDSKI